MQQKTKSSVVGSTVIEGMMIGGYSEGTEITLPNGVTVECVNGEVWMAINDEEELLGYFNPLNIATGREVAEEIEEISSRSVRNRGY